MERSAEQGPACPTVIWDSAVCATASVRRSASRVCYTRPLLIFPPGNNHPSALDFPAAGRSDEPAK